MAKRAEVGGGARHSRASAALSSFEQYTLANVYSHSLHTIVRTPGRTVSRGIGREKAGECRNGKRLNFGDQIADVGPSCQVSTNDVGPSCQIFTRNDEP